MSDLFILVKSLVLFRKRNHYLAKLVPDVVAGRPASFFSACHQLGVDSLNCLYLGTYRITIDSHGRSISESIVTQGHYQLDIAEQVAEIVKDRSIEIVNVGANVGSTIFNLASLGFTRFAAFEPAQKNFSLLEQNMRRNGIGARLYPKAVSDRRGSARIHIHPVSGGRHSLVDQFEGGSDELVDLMMLDDIAFEDSCFLWCDAEGAELQVLRGARNFLASHCVGCCIEITPRLHSDAELAEMAEILQGHFSCFSILPDMRHCGDLTVQLLRLYPRLDLIGHNRTRQLDG